MFQSYTSQLCLPVNLDAVCRGGGGRIILSFITQRYKIKFVVYLRNGIVDSKSIFHTQFNAIFRFLKSTLVFWQSLRLLATACRDAHRTFVLNYPLTLVTRHDKPRQLNVKIAS